MRHLIFVLGLTLNMYRCALAITTGPFSSHCSFCLVQRERPGKAVKETYFLSTSVLHHSTPRSNSNTSRAFCTANFKRWEMI